MADRSNISSISNASNILDSGYFEKLRNVLLKLQKPKQHFFMDLHAENSQFARFNQAKIRQIGKVEDASLEISMIYEGEAGRQASHSGQTEGLRKCSRSISLSGLFYEDQTRIQQAWEALHAEAVQLPIDPYAQVPDGKQTSLTERRSPPLNETNPPIDILQAAGDLDLAGIYAAGPIVRAMASSSGQFHWFLTENFSLDYSLFTPSSQRALKETFAGNHWDLEKFRNQLQSASQRLSILKREPVCVSRGKHRCYLAPAAVAELVHMLSWGCIGEAAIQQGDSPLRRLRSKEKVLSPLFTLNEDFRSGEVPRFNSEGELAPENLSLITQGTLTHSLISSRSAKEYKVISNQAEESETLRSPAVLPGELAESEILKQLDEGLYLSNLHYLNWSDQPGGRITGMTRYACFWVEKGQIQAPIENMRFDDTLFSLFGNSLEALTTVPSYIPDVGTYEGRNVGGVWTPGILISGMNFTL